MGEKNGFADREEIRSVIAKSGRLLDRGGFTAYLELYTADGRYSMEAKNEEIGRDTVWMRLTRTELASLLKELPQHVRDKAHRTHMVTTDEIALSGASAKAVSTFAVFRTTLVGETAVYALGSYEDELVAENGAWKIKSRVARVETRSLTTPTPLPL
jgi:3-phenylpropionate/cinnamic acid dioxygenase small subunit